MVCTVEITYKYSKLDKGKQFGLVFNYPIGHETYIRWVYFYMGEYFNKKKISLYPFDIGNSSYYKDKIKKKTFKHCNNAERQAKLIVNHINKILNK